MDGGFLGALELELRLLSCVQAHVYGLGAVRALLRLGLGLRFPFSVYLSKRTVLRSNVYKIRAQKSVLCGDL